MTDDLVKRLRDWSEYDEGKINDAREEAADRIEALGDALKVSLETCMEMSERNKELETALQFYKDGFRYHVKRTSTGINLSEWKPTEELLNDCGETARSVLAGEKKDA
jgi:hypothetical protein